MALICSGCFLCGQRVAAQDRQVYLSAGTGATDLSGGVDWPLPTMPVAVGVEFGAGNLFWGSLTASYQPFAGRFEGKTHPFVRVSVTGLASSPYSATGMSLGGGFTYWLGQHVGVRTEALKFWPTFSEDVPDPTFTPRLWAARAGIAIRW